MRGVAQRFQAIWIVFLLDEPVARERPVMAFRVIPAGVFVEFVQQFRHADLFVQFECRQIACFGRGVRTDQSIGRRNVGLLVTAEILLYQPAAIFVLPIQPIAFVGHQDHARKSHGFIWLQHEICLILTACHADAVRLLCEIDLPVALPIQHGDDACSSRGIFQIETRHVVACAFSVRDGVTDSTVQPLAERFEIRERTCASAHGMKRIRPRLIVDDFINGLQILDTRRRSVMIVYQDNIILPNPVITFIFRISHIQPQMMLLATEGHEIA